MSPGHTLIFLGMVVLPVWLPLSNLGGIKPSDILIAAGLFLLWIHPQTWRNLRAPRLLLATSLFGASILFATLLEIAYGVSPMTGEGVVLLARFVLNVLLFITIYQGAYQYADSLLRVLVFPATLVPFLALLQDVRTHGFGLTFARFQGFTPSPNTAALGLEVALCVGAVMAAQHWMNRRPQRSLTWGVVAVLALAMILLSQSRAYLLASIVAPTTGVLLLMWRRRRGKGLRTLTVISATITVWLGILLIAPPTFTQELSRRWNIEDRGPGLVRHLFIANFFDETRQTRRSSVEYYLGLFRTNPFGLGVNFQETYLASISVNDELHGPNSIVDILAYGGVGAAGAFVWGLVIVLRRARNILKSDTLPIVPFAALTSLLGIGIAGILIGSPIFTYHPWILLALLFAKGKAIAEPVSRV